jgi:serine/threonine protein kinase
MTLHRANFEIGMAVGDYEILSVLGRGGMGKVFKVRNVISDRVEAIKVLLPDLDPSPDLEERFLREIRVVAALDHPGIASLRTALRVDNQSGDPKLTGVGVAVGSLHYMSPEQMKAETPDARSDLYSVGVTLYEMVTGQPPVQGNSIYAILRAHLEEKPRPAIELAPEIGHDLSGILAKSLEKNPAARFQSAEEFHAALSRISQPAATSMFQVPPSSDPPPLKSLVLPTPTPLPLQSTPPTANPKSETGSKSWDPGILDNARKSLAVYVGPMAKVLVSRAAKTARTSEELYRALAKEISTSADREKFLRSQHL